MPPFTAVFAGNDSSAVGFMRAAREAGLRCPEDYSIVGFDNNPEFSPYIDPPLASFRQPVEDLGKATGTILLSLIRGEKPETFRHIFQPEFVPRASLGAPPTKPRSMHP
jgi:DNA-binding LacI/PurR family transcriptional regulator